MHFQPQRGSKGATGHKSHCWACKNPERAWELYNTERARPILVWFDYKTCTLGYTVSSILDLLPLATNASIGLKLPLDQKQVQDVFQIQNSQNLRAWNEWRFILKWECYVGQKFDHPHYMWLHTVRCRGSVSMVRTPWRPASLKQASRSNA